MRRSYPGQWRPNSGAFRPHRGGAVLPGNLKDACILMVVAAMPHK
jgi:hypothetical protein